jgi:hypothetical protein
MTLNVRDGNNSPNALKSTVVSGEHIPHHNIDVMPPVTISSVALTPTITQIILVNADTQYSINLNNVAKVSFASRQSNTVIRFAYANNVVASGVSNFRTLPIDCEKSEDFINSRFTGTLYFASPTAGTVVEIEYWV